MPDPGKTTEVAFLISTVRKESIDKKNRKAKKETDTVSDKSCSSDMSDASSHGFKEKFSLRNFYNSTKEKIKQHHTKRQEIKLKLMASKNEKLMEKKGKGDVVNVLDRKKPAEVIECKDCDSAIEKKEDKCEKYEKYDKYVNYISECNSSDSDVKMNESDLDRVYSRKRGRPNHFFKFGPNWENDDTDNEALKRLEKSKHLICKRKYDRVHIIDSESTSEEDILQTTVVRPYSLYIQDTTPKTTKRAYLSRFNSEHAIYKQANNLKIVQETNSSITFTKNCPEAVENLKLLKSQNYCNIVVDDVSCEDFTDTDDDFAKRMLVLHEKPMVNQIDSCNDTQSLYRSRSSNTVSVCQVDSWMNAGFKKYESKNIQCGDSTLRCVEKRSSDFAVQVQLMNSRECRKRWPKMVDKDTDSSDLNSDEDHRRVKSRLSFLKKFKNTKKEPVENASSAGESKSNINFKHRIPVRIKNYQYVKKSLLVQDDYKIFSIKNSTSLSNASKSTNILEKERPSASTSKKKSSNTKPTKSVSKVCTRVKTR